MSQGSAADGVAPTLERSMLRLVRRPSVHVDTRGCRRLLTVTRRLRERCWPSRLLRAKITIERQWAQCASPHGDYCCLAHRAYPAEPTARWAFGLARFGSGGLATR